MNQEQINARRKYYKEYYEKRKKHISEYRKKYRKDNPDKVEQWESNRWSRVAEIYNTLDKVEGR